MSDVNSIPDVELIRRVINSVCRVPRSTQARTVPLWQNVSEAFCLGSTYSQQLCRRFGFDPDKQVKP